MAESGPSSANHDSTAPSTCTMLRDSHSERTWTSLLVVSNETDERSKSPPRRRMSPCKRAASVTATRISTIRSLPGRNVDSDQGVGVGQIWLQPALLRVDSRGAGLLRAACYLTAPIAKAPQ